MTIFRVISHFFKSKPFAGFAVLLFLLLGFSWPGLLLGDFFVFGDIDFGFTLKNYNQRIIGAWNENGSTANFFNLTRAPIAGLIWLLHSIFGLSSGRALSFLIFVFLYFSGLGMLRFCWYFFKKTLEKMPTWALGAGAFFAAAAYMLSPWAIIRVQHLYLLVGYAALPWSAFFTLRFWDKLRIKEYKKSVKFLILLALVWALGSGAVHYFFFIGIFVGFFWLYQLYDLWIREQTKSLLIGSLSGFLLIILVLLLLSHALAPQIWAAAQVSISPKNINAIDSLSLFSRFSSWQNSFMHLGYWWPLLPKSALPSSFNALIFPLLGLFFLGGYKAMFSRAGRFILGFTLLFFVLSLGTNSPMRSVLVYLVFKSPLSGILGFLFRDPNKLTALFAFGQVVLLGLGICAWLNVLHQKTLQEKMESLARKVMDLPANFGLGTGLWATRFSVLFFGIVGVLWLRPVLIYYADNYYNETEIPAEYQWIMESPSEGKSLFLPRYEAEKSPGKGFAETTWNPGRPTSAIETFSANHQIYNTTEGATPATRQFYAFIKKNLLQQKTEKTKALLKKIGIENLYYHADLLGHEKKDTKILKTLREDNLGEESLGFMHKFSLGAPPKNKKNIGAIIFGGYDALLSTLHLPGAEKANFATWFGGLIPNTHKIAQTGDILVSRFKSDLVMNNLQDFLVYPFSHNLHADGFTRWGVSQIGSQDWGYHATHAGLASQFGRFNHFQGIIFTHVPAMLDVEPYENLEKKGELYLSTKELSGADEDFWSSTSPELLEVRFRPSRLVGEPILHGEIAQGNENYWQVATSRPIKAKEKTAYGFRLQISGQDVNKLHGKVKFLSENGKEIGVGYVSAPENAPNPQKLNFDGKFITPIGTSSMKLELWAHRPPEQKTFWWVHDLQIYSFEKDTKPNIFSFRHKIKQTGKQRVFAQVLLSPKGGEIGLKFPRKKSKSTIKINTKTKKVTELAWVDLGVFDINSSLLKIEIENKYGFNAVSAIAFVPLVDYEIANKKIEKVQSKTKHVAVIEAESQTEWSGNIQSHKYQKTASQGKFLQLKNGELGAKIESEGGEYSLWVRTKSTPNGTWNFAIQNKDKNLMRKELKTEKSPEKLEWVKIGKSKLPKGEIEIKAQAKYDGENLMPTSSIHEFLYAREWKETEGYRDTLTKKERSDECCDCVDLGDNFLDVNFEKNLNTSQLSIIPGCSCWWVISASAIAKVEAKEEYLLEFNARSAFAVQNHFKVIFLDEDKTFLDYHRLEKTPETDSYDWENIERIVTPPKGTKYAQLQIWSRENRFNESRMEIKNLSFYPLLSFPTLDAIVLVEGNPKSLEELWEVDESAREKVILTEETGHSPLWQNSGRKALPEMGIRNGYLLKKSEKREDSKFTPEKIYSIWAWVSLIALGCLVLLLIGMRMMNAAAPPHQKTGKNKYGKGENKKGSDTRKESK